MNPIIEISNYRYLNRWEVYISDVKRVDHKIKVDGYEIARNIADQLHDAILR